VGAGQRRPDPAAGLGRQALPLRTGRLPAPRCDVTDQLHRYLSDITERRLVATHGISRVADPGKAAELLGPELAGFLDHPRARRMSLQEIDRLLTRIEAL
jgi:hypothetical protein